MVVKAATGSGPRESDIFILARGLLTGRVARMGHNSIETTRTFYVPAVPERMKQASEKLVGRLAGAGLVPWTGSMNARQTKRKKAELLRKTRQSQSHADTAPRGPDRKKTA